MRQEATDEETASGDERPLMSGYRRRMRDAGKWNALPPRPALRRPSSVDDNLGRDFDFYLEHFPEEPGPREIILPHNPAITKEIDVQVGGILIGRPLGMSCGCPITHFGVATQVDMRNGRNRAVRHRPAGSAREGF